MLGLQTNSIFILQRVTSFFKWLHRPLSQPRACSPTDVILSHNLMFHRVSDIFTGWGAKCIGSPRDLFCGINTTTQTQHIIFSRQIYSLAFLWRPILALMEYFTTCVKMCALWTIGGWYIAVSGFYHVHSFIFTHICFSIHIHFIVILINLHKAQRGTI